MTGFDSESDRREAVRKQIIDECVVQVNRTIITRSITHAPAEEIFLLATVIERLCSSLRLDMRRIMMCEEINTVKQEIEDK